MELIWVDIDGIWVLQLAIFTLLKFWVLQDYSHTKQSGEKEKEKGALYSCLRYVNNELPINRNHLKIMVKCRDPIMC